MNPDQAALHCFIRGERIGPADWKNNPMACALGSELVAIDPEAMTLEMRFTPQAQFLQGAGVLQGGAVTAMLDFAMAFAAMAVLPAGRVCSTADLNVRFLRPAPLGSYRAIGEVEKLGRQLLFSQARLFSGDAPRQLVAAGSARLLLQAAS